MPGVGGTQRRSGARGPRRRHISSLAEVAVTDLRRVYDELTCAVWGTHRLTAGYVIECDFVTQRCGKVVT